LRQRVGNIEFGSRLSTEGTHWESDPIGQGALTEIRSPRHQEFALRGIAAPLNTRGHRTRVALIGGWNRRPGS
jgi:hypothetical protein